MMASPVVVFWQQTICPEFSSQHPVPSQQFGHHIAIADLRPHERDMQFLQSQLQAEVAHQGADHTTLQPPAFLQVARDEEKQFVAIHDRTGMVDHHHPVAVAVEGDAEVGMVLDHRSLQAIQVVEPHLSLMFRPFGLAASTVTSAPSSRKTLGAIL